MMQAKKIMVLTIGLSLMGIGCSNLRPPPGDKQAWEAQQKVEATKNANDPVGDSLYLAYVLGELGYALSGGGK